MRYPVRSKLLEVFLREKVTTVTKQNMQLVGTVYCYTYICASVCMYVCMYLHMYAE